MHVERVEMVRQVEPAQCETESVFRMDLKIARKPAVERKELREPLRVCLTNVILPFINDGEWKSVSEFDNRRIA